LCVIKALRRPLGVRWRNPKLGYSDIFLPLESSPGSDMGPSDGWEPIIDEDDDDIGFNNLCGKFSLVSLSSLLLLLLDTHSNNPC